jgi:hypothetical protein
MHMHIGGKENEKIQSYTKIKICQHPKLKRNPPRLSGYTQTTEHQGNSTSIDPHTLRTTLLARRIHVLILVEWFMYFEHIVQSHCNTCPFNVSSNIDVHIKLH